MKKAMLSVVCRAVLALALLPAAPAVAAEPVRIDVVLPLTGPGSFAGASERTALDALASNVNKNGAIRGRRLEFAYADDQSNPQTAVQLTNGLIAGKVNVILGSALTATCNAMAALVKNGPLMYCFSGGYQPVPDSYAFGGSISSTYLVAAGVRYLRMRNLKRIALITTTDSSGQDGDRAVAEAVASGENAGLTIVAREHFNPGDVTVAAQMARIKSAAPDAVIAWTTGTPLATVLRGLNDAGLENLPIVVSSGNAVYAQLKQYDAFIPKALYIPSDAVLAPNKVTDRRHRAAIDTVLAAMAPAKPDFLSITAWDPALLVVAALRQLGPDASAERLRAYIANLKGFVGVNGAYDFARVPNRGVDQSEVYIVRYNPATNSFTGVSKAGGEPVR
ncbi:MAG TPA: ABC transporter substrate-binding protein [Candidatus Lustribacter sp.]